MQASQPVTLALAASLIGRAEGCGNKKRRCELKPTRIYHIYIYCYIGRKETGTHGRRDRDRNSPEMEACNRGDGDGGKKGEMGGEGLQRRRALPRVG